MTQDTRFMRELRADSVLRLVAAMAGVAAERRTSTGTSPWVHTGAVSDIAQAWTLVPWCGEAGATPAEMMCAAGAVAKTVVERMSPGAEAIMRALWTRGVQAAPLPGRKAYALVREAGAAVPPRYVAEVSSAYWRMLSQARKHGHPDLAGWSEGLREVEGNGLFRAESLARVA